MKDFTSKLIALTEDTNRMKRKSVDTELINEQKQILNNQMKQALKNQLTKLDVDYNNLKQKLDKEVENCLEFAILIFFDDDIVSYA